MDGFSCCKGFQERAVPLVADICWYRELLLPWFVYGWYHLRIEPSLKHEIIHAFPFCGCSTFLLIEQFVLLFPPETKPPVSSCVLFPTFSVFQTGTIKKKLKY